MISFNHNEADMGGAVYVFMVKSHLEETPQLHLIKQPVAMRLYILVTLRLHLKEIPLYHLIITKPTVVVVQCVLNTLISPLKDTPWYHLIQMKHMLMEVQCIPNTPL